MSHPRLSVVLPVLNESRHLGSVLKQLQEQAPVPGGYEVLVVDGGSTDGTRALVEEQARGWSALRCLGNPKRRSSPARNIGAAHARGSLVLYLDGHCRIPRTDFLKRVVELFESSNADCLCRPQPLEEPAESPWGKAISHARHSIFGHNPGSDIYSGEPGFTQPETAGAAYRHHVLTELGGYDERFDACEDVEFNHRVSLAGYRSYKHPDLAVSYVPRNSLYGLFNQMVRYGRGRARLMARHPRMTSGILLGLSLGVLLVLLAAVAVPLTVWVGMVAVLLGVYAVACIGFALSVSRSLETVLHIAAVFPVIHGGLVAGFIRGLPETAYFRMPPPEPPITFPKKRTMSRPPADPNPAALGTFEKPPSGENKAAKRVLIVLGVIALGGTFGYLLTTVHPFFLFGVLFGLAGVVAIFAYPYVGLLIYTVLYVTRPGEIYPVLAVLRPERMIAILTLGAMLFSMIRNERRLYIDGSRQTALFFAFMLVAFATLFTSYWPGQTVARVILLLKVFSFYLMIVHLIDTRFKLKLFIYTLLSMIGYLAFSSVKGYYSGEIMFAQGIQRAIGATSAGGDPNALGGTLGSALGLCLFVAFASRKLWIKGFFLAVAGASIWTMSLTGSRATLLGLLAAGFFLWLMSSRKFLIAVCSIGVLAGTFILLPDSYKERYSSVTSSEIDASTQGRFKAWQHGAEMFADRPFLGVGLGCFSVAHAEAYSEDRNFLESHSLYVQVPAETGLLGVITFFSFVFVAIRKNRQLTRILSEDRTDWEFEIAVLKGVFVGFMFLGIFSFFGHSLMRYTWYIYAAIGVAMTRLNIDLPASSPEPDWEPESRVHEA